MTSAKELIRRMPKAELHMHLEGSLEPDLMFRLARRNGITLPWKSEQDLQAAYSFTNLQSFLEVYYAGLTVLLKEQDFFDMTRAYLERAHADNVVHTEVFISPQAHTRRNVALGAVIEGIEAALKSAQKDLGVTSRLILGIQRQWSEEDALSMIDSARPWRDRVAGLGMGGPELPHPPQKFVRAFAHARELGWRTMAHAGEEGPASYVADTLDLLKVDRIDHGVRCEEDPALVARLAELQIPLTVCPVSNVKLHVFPDLAAHNIKRLLDKGVCVTMNSDDPSYFLGYVNDNFEGCEAALGLTRQDLYKLARNSFTASFLKEEEKQRHIAKLDAVFNS
jgi:adenine deaminase